MEVDEGARTLKIAGVDAAGTTIARLELEHGRFDVEDLGMADGIRLTVDVLGAKVEHTSAGEQPRQLPLFSQHDLASVNEFLQDAQVASALARWHVTFRAPRRSLEALLAPSQREVPRAGCTYAPTTQCGAIDCEEVGHDTWDPNLMCHVNGSVGVDQAVCCGNTKIAGLRTCGMGASNPCGTEGPAGCVTCWSQAWTTACDAVVLTPYNVCMENGEPYMSPYDVAYFDSTY